ncbi:MAG: tetratricopeptide repeat protein [Spirochaetaceae bacterium]|jgi:tetratricopeptide (TPR) repeat protein|nr:tetratricopeptide repeat protein [Spirochaetaceae bacterium]
MKKIIHSFILIAVLLCSLYAQEGTDPEMAEAVRGYYRVFSQRGWADADALARELEQRFNEYNRLFHFDKQKLRNPLVARAFESREAYNAYVSSRLGRTREGAVYLHYNQPDRRELVILRGSPEEPWMLAHQAFIQFLRAFISSPPSWMQEGFAIYFNTLGFDRTTEKLTYEENLSWLDEVKNLGTATPPLESILLADIRGVPENFQGFSWALVSFLLNSGNADYFRALIESFLLLSDSASAALNSEAVMKRITLWTGTNTLQNDYQTYLIGRKTFRELIDEGQKAYETKDYAGAERSFLKALDQRPAHYAPYYYLGLLAYEGKKYDQAEGHYRSALQYGADQALVQYARGLNAAAQGRNTDAITCLQEAARLSPQRYKERVENLISGMK